MDIWFGYLHESLRNNSHQPVQLEPQVLLPILLRSFDEQLVEEIL